MNAVDVLSHVRAINNKSFHSVKNSRHLGETIFQKSFRQITFLLSFAAANTLLHCHFSLYASSSLKHIECDFKRPVLREKMTKQGLYNLLREHTLFFACQ